MTTMKIGNITNTARAVLMLSITVSVFVTLSASASAPVNIQITDANAQSGHTTTTQITINNMTNFGAATVTLSYAPAVVHITSVAAGDVGTPIANIDNTAGTATIAAYVSTATGPDSPITFANLELLAVGSSGETSPLTLAITTFADADGASVSATPINGTFVVSTGVKGDLKRDGQITTADACVALELAASREWNADADVDGDGQVTSLDVTMILQAAAGAISL